MMKSTPSTSPHIHSDKSVGRVMRQVLYALIPGIFCATWFFGWGIIINIAVASVTALIAEVALLRMRNRPIQPFLSDYSALVTAFLLAICLPSLAPWWMVMIGTAFAIVIAKHLYGGLGNNPFNPAMIGYVVLLISFPQPMTQWINPVLMESQPLTLQQSLAISFGTDLATTGLETSVDAISSATLLDHVKTEIKKGTTLNDALKQTKDVEIAGINSWGWVNIGFLLGGLWLLRQRVIRWQIPAAMLIGIFLPALLLHLIRPELYAGPLFHLLSGGTMLGAFFIATDPVTACTTPKGRIIYGAGIGLFVYIIRTWGGYPDGIAFAVLLMNMTVPMLDYYTQPIVHGQSARDKSK